MTREQAEAILGKMHEKDIRRFIEQYDEYVDYVETVAPICLLCGEHPQEGEHEEEWYWRHPGDACLEDSCKSPLLESVEDCEQLKIAIENKYNPDLFL